MIVQKMCRTCRKPTAHERQQSISHGLGCVLVFVSGGLWLFIQIPYTLWLMCFPTYVCGHCGAARGR